MPLLAYLAHRRDCKAKQTQRENAIASLPPDYHGQLKSFESEILNTPVEEAAALVRRGAWKPIDILRAYGKRAVQAHEQTNCLTEVLIPSAAEWLAHSYASDTGKGAEGVAGEAFGGVCLSGSLAGIPVSIKDTLNVKGFDSCIGYSKLANHPATSDAPIVKLLKDAGAVPFVKTNVPVTLLSFECANDVWGRTENPHVKGFSPGGSSGGEAALLALGGSRIGIGSDVAGSVRIPAHYSGVYSVKCSAGRFPKAGGVSTTYGQEGVPAVYSPMAKTVGDLSYLTKSVIDMEPWKYDHTVLPIPWRDVREEMEGKKVRWGVLRDDGIVTPSPACQRALDSAIAVLGDEFHAVVELENTPSVYESLRCASLLLGSDGGYTFSSSFRSIFENNDPGAGQMSRYFSLPRWAKFLHWAFIRYIKRDILWAGLLRHWHAKSAAELWKLAGRREVIRADWHRFWNENNLDFVLSVPNALPAIPHGGGKRAFSSCSYTFLWNLMDYTAAVLPVTTVDKEKDALGEGFQVNKNAIAKGEYECYDAAKMHGLPVGVQVIGRRLEEEKVLWAVELLDRLLKEKQNGYRVVEC